MQQLTGGKGRRLLSPNTFVYDDENYTISKAFKAYVYMYTYIYIYKNSLSAILRTDN